MSITHIVLTGGPCAGKTTMLSRMTREFSDRGYKVLVVPETATELILSGITVGSPNFTSKYFQHYVLEKQLHKEKLSVEAAKAMNQDKTLIVYDRGLMDGQAYVESTKDFDEVLESSNLTRVDAMSHYDAVIHLVTAAKGAEEAYTKANNAARIETVDEAGNADERTLAAWVGHPHLRVIDNSTGFEEKVQRAMKEVYSVLGEPVPVEIERKFLIKRPHVEVLELYGAVRSDIIQTYLLSEDGVECRVRQRGANGSYAFFYTEKREISGIERTERERKLTQREYLDMLLDADPSTHPLIKTRYCFVWESKYFELDIFPNDPDKALLEIELTDKSDEVTVPVFLEVLEEVTNNPMYRNRKISERLGKL